MTSPQVDQCHAITDLELTCLVYNIHYLSQRLKNRYLDILVNHKAIENLQKREKGTNKNRLATLLLKL